MEAFLRAWKKPESQWRASPSISIHFLSSVMKREDNMLLLTSAQNVTYKRDIHTYMNKHRLEREREVDSNSRQSQTKDIHAERSYQVAQEIRT